MSKALNEVMNYANEDEVSIYPHWIVYLKAAVSTIIPAIFVFPIVFLIARTRFKVWGITLIIFLIVAAYRFFQVHAYYSTTVITVNNIRIYGETGLAENEIISAPLDTVGHAQCVTSFLGRKLGYGTISIVLETGPITLTDMVNARKFCEAVILMKEAYGEAARIRQDERNDKSRHDAAVIGAQATIEGAKIQAQLQSEMQAQLLEGVLDRFVDKLSQSNVTPQNKTEQKQIEDNRAADDNGNTSL